MTRLLSICVVLVASHTAVAQDISVLFVGNSYTNGNNLPRLIAKLCAEGQRGVEVYVEKITPGGCTFQRHIEQGEVAKRLQARKWDFVVLQEQSQMPVLYPDVTKQYGRKLHKLIAAAGAKTVFFMTWARQHKPEMINGLAATYTSMATELGARLAPVGLAFRDALTLSSPPVLHRADKSHPTELGSYLAACVIYRTLTGVDPRGRSNLGLKNVSREQARLLQNVAWKVTNGR